LLLVAIDVRNLVKSENLQMSILHYLKNLQPIMSGFDQLTYDSPHIQRLYAKDIDCLLVGRDKMSKLQPKETFYLPLLSPPPLPPASPPPSP
jgi:hypothetical protein